MSWHSAGKKNEYAELVSRIVEIKGISIGVYRFRDSFYAYLNWCPHQGGPACEGSTFGDTIVEVASNGSRLREYVSIDEFNIACPWHGFDFRLSDGTSRTNRKLRLKKFEVMVQGEDVLIKI